MSETRSALTARTLIVEGLRDTLRAPFSVLVGLSLFVYVVSSSLAAQPGEGSFLFALLLAVVTAYAQIACALAAADTDTQRSADGWFIAAIRRRCLLRFVVTELLTLLMVAAGLLLLVVGAFLVGGLVALAQTATVLERRGPIDAIKRSAELGRDARRTLTIVFGFLVLLPGAAIQLAYQFEVSESLGAGWLVLSVPAVLLTLAGTIALARAFVTLAALEQQ